MISGVEIQVIYRAFIQISRYRFKLEPPNKRCYSGKGIDSLKKIWFSVLSMRDYFFFLKKNQGPCSIRIEAIVWYSFKQENVNIQPRPSWFFHSLYLLGRCAENLPKKNYVFFMELLLTFLKIQRLFSIFSKNDARMLFRLVLNARPTASPLLLLNTKV